MPKNPKQADGEIHEDQVLNFLVNVLTGAFTLDFGENAEIDPEDLFEVQFRTACFGSVFVANPATKHSKSSSELRYDVTNIPLPMSVFQKRFARSCYNFHQRTPL